MHLSLCPCMALRAKKNNYFDLILKYADKYKPPKHNTKYSNRYYLTHILDVLGDVVLANKKQSFLLATR